MFVRLPSDNFNSRKFLLLPVCVYEELRRAEGTGELSQ